MIPRIGVSRRPTASLARCQGGRTASLPEEHQDRLGRQASLPPGRASGQAGRRPGGARAAWRALLFDSMAFGMAGKCAFPLRRKPRRS